MHIAGHAHGSATKRYCKAHLWHRVCIGPGVDLAAAVPENPRLAPGVKLAGQMQESAFEQPPWLIERQGQGYIQVPRPLYNVARNADGQHSLGDIAREVAETDGLRLSSDNVRHLIATQLIPNGVIPTTDGKVLAAPTQSRSALAIKRIKTIEAAGLHGVTGMLQVVFWPPLLVLMLGLSTALLVWLYGLHGLGGPIHDALYFPGFLPLLVLAVVVSAGFHELGHAAALRYGGGTPRSFGFGMYLMYPVFFTDVSDNYRLRRWARVRTDLAGFYFNLIFAMGVFAAYWLTRQEALLVIILAMNVDIVRQLMPFVRLDGYWTLADLTGVPDFLSKFGPFVRTSLPFLRKEPGKTFPRLKWWARLVFVVYMLVAIPAMVALLVLMVRNVPRVLMTAWDSLGQQAASFMQAQQSADVLRMAGAVGEGILIVIPAGGLVYSLYRLGRFGVLSGWKWSQGSTGRRSVFGLASLIVGVLVYAMWAPQFPLPGHGPSPVYSPNAFTPIGPDERLSLGDAFAGTVVARADQADGGVQAPGSAGEGRSSGSAPSGSAPGAPAGSGSTPGGSAPRGSAPGASTVSGSAPGAPAVSGSTPGGSAASGSGPGANTASGSTSGASTVSGSAPDASTASSSTPDGSAASDSAPDASTASGSLPGGAAVPGVGVSAPPAVQSVATAVPATVAQAEPTLVPAPVRAAVPALPAPAVPTDIPAAVTTEVPNTVTRTVHTNVPNAVTTVVATAVATRVASTLATVVPTDVATPVASSLASVVPTDVATPVASSVGAANGATPVPAGVVPANVATPAPMSSPAVP